MNPHAPHYMTPQAFTDHYGAQLRKALPNLVDLPIVNSRMTAARANGLNWNDGFAYALEQRRAISAMRADVHAGAAGTLPSGPHLDAVAQ